MTVTEKEVLLSLSMAVIALLEPHKVKSYDLTPSERVRGITKALEDMHDEDMHRQREDDATEQQRVTEAPKPVVDLMDALRKSLPK